MDKYLIARWRAPWMALVLLLPLAQAFAQVYKWVDSAGQTHYSSSKSEAGAAKAAEVKIASQPAPAHYAEPSTAYLQTPSKYALPQRPPEMRPYGPTQVKRPKALSDGRDHGTDASRCALARDVLSGAVRHGNGKRTDQYDREVAQNDINAFCGNR